jgi:hypothetical protein
MVRGSESLMLSGVLAYTEFPTPTLSVAVPHSSKPPASLEAVVFWFSTRVLSVSILSAYVENRKHAYR